MRNIPAALATHIEGEVISLAKCLKITKTNGAILRLTTHDVNLTINGEVYFSNVALDLTAIQTSSDLSVDNGEATIGLDEVKTKKNDFTRELYTNAKFELFVVNWQDLTNGLMYLKRGWVGDVTVLNDSSVKLQLLGLTKALQKTIVEKYSPTCRTSLGSDKCGVPNIPLRIRRRKQRVKTYDWFLVPNTNVSTYSLTNPGFESDGAVANGTSGISGWTYGYGSYWSVANTFTADTGTYYLAGGNDSGGAGTGAEMYLYQTVTTATLGMVNANIDTGDYTIDFAGVMAGTSATDINPGYLSLELIDATGETLMYKESNEIDGIYQTWQGLGVTLFVLPGTRSIRFGVRARKDNGVAASVAFDALTARFWTNVIGTFGGAAFKTTAIPAATNARAPVGYLASAEPTFNYTLAATTTDGEATCTAAALVFAFDTVDTVTDNRTFTVSSISQTAQQMYSAKIVWLSGLNAGRTSFVRIWNNTSKVAKIYDLLPNDITVGDKFVYAIGCDKTIETCSAVFGNAVNFRGEPYLPGPNKVIEFLTRDTTE
jgi:uncharacterized phage protein (TIGR02218 family)